MGVSVNGGELEFDAVINAGQFNAAISAIEKQLTSLTRKAEDEGKAVDNVVKKTALAIASYASVATAKNFIGDIVRVRGEFQKLEVSFNTMLKSKSAADKLLAQATDLAAKTPFTLQEVGSSAKQLLAYGFAARDVTKNIEMLGNIASGVGAPLGDIVYLYGTLRTQGRAYTRDIMQFTSRGIPIISELAKQFGVTEDKVKELVEQGKVGFPEVEKAFRSLTSESGLFFNLMQEQSKTLTGLTSNLEDAWSRMLNEIGKSNEGLFTDAIKGAIAVVDNYQQVLDIIKVLIATYGTYRAAIIVTNAVTAISTSLTKGWTIAEILRYKAMVISERAMKILNATMLSNPAVAVATGIALLTSAFIFLRKESDNVKKSQQLLAESQQTVGDKFAETKAKIQPYVEALKNANLSETERLNIYEKLKAIDPEIVKGLNAKSLSYKNLSDNVNLYLNKLREQYALEANREALTKSIKIEQDLEKQIKQKEAAIKAAVKAGKENTLVFGDNGKPTTFAKAQQEGIDLLKAQLTEQQKVTTELGQTQVNAETKTQEAKLRTVEVIDQEIEAEKTKQKRLQLLLSNTRNTKKRLINLRPKNYV
jgi:tape measure domain-containing protein